MLRSHDFVLHNCIVTCQVTSFTRYQTFASMWSPVAPDASLNQLMLEKIPENHWPRIPDLSEFLNVNTDSSKGCVNRSMIEHDYK